MSDDPHAPLRDRVLLTVLHGPGASAPRLREAAAANADLPELLASLIHRIHAHAYRVTDEDVAHVQAAYGDDATFELIVSAALGASHRRLVAGLRALDEA